MYDDDSRYAPLASATCTLADGRQVSYTRRRFLPRPEALQELTRVRVGATDRLDLIAHASYGDPLQYWRIADANAAMNPLELLEQTGRVLRVPVPELER